MNRRHKADEYLRLIERIRNVRPDMALSGDFIVGFPGETDQDFEDTMQLVRDVNYAQAYSFKYSPRPGTPGADLDDHVEEAVKDERLQRLQALPVGTAICFPGFDDRPQDGCASGEARPRGGPDGGPLATGSCLSSSMTSKDRVGDIIHVKIVSTGTNSLIAQKLA